MEIQADITSRQKRWLAGQGIKTLEDLQNTTDDDLWDLHHWRKGVFTAACIKNLRKWQAKQERIHADES